MQDITQKILSDITIFNKYARYIPELKRRESWEEICQRGIDMHSQKFPLLKDEIVTVYKDYVIPKKVLPSMRGSQFSGKPILINNARIFNCSYTAIDDWRAFSEGCFLLLSGCGFGYSVQQHHIKKLPEIRQPIKTKKYLIADSIIGWADAVKVLCKAYFFGERMPIFDFSEIRPEGALLVTSGGRAPGPIPLKDMLHNIKNIFDRKKVGEKLTSLECHDIMCFIAQSVLTAGIRRSAMIAGFNLNDEEMLTCKYGAWWEKNPQRALANNSAIMLRHKITKDKFFDVWKKIEESKSGEPSVFFSNDKDSFCNPCLVGDTKVALADGRGILTIKELADIGDDVSVFCLNNKKQITIRYMRAPRVTGYQRPIFKITLDSGDIIRCTDNHKFLLKTGEYKETKNLQKNDSLFLLTKYKASIKDIFYENKAKSQDYWWLTTGSGQVKGEHRYIAEFFNNTILQTGQVVHHKDYNAINNNPENLEIMSKESHDKIHIQNMLGDKNPMRRAKYEWSKEKWDSYKAKQSKNNIADKNSNYSGYTNDDLKNHALILTKKLGYRFSIKDWVEYAKEKNLPQGFSKWRKDHLGGIKGLAKWAALELKLEHIDLDPRIVKNYKKYLSQGYDCFIENEQVFYKKRCEICKTELITKKREISRHLNCHLNKGYSLLSNKTKKNIKKKSLISIKQSKEIKKQNQIKIYLELKSKIENIEKKDWIEACKLNNISFRIGPTSPFLYWKDLKEAASNYNHKVISVEFDGYEDVYNGTVDEFHNFFIGGFESKTQNDKDKLQFVNNLQCGEISLTSIPGDDGGGEFCNLTEINASDIITQEEFNARARAATFIGTIQASYTDFHYLRNGWKEITEKNSLLGVGITGIANENFLKLNFTEASLETVKENERVAKIIGINKAARITTVKPSGTTACVTGTSSGIHAWFAKYYIRRMRLGKEEPLYKYLKRNLPELVEDEFLRPKTMAVVSIPQRAPEGAILRTESPINLLERVKKIKHEWITPSHRKGSNMHNVSTTISIKDNEWSEVGEWMWENRDIYNGISVLPYDSHTYKQAPFEEITKEQFEELLPLLKDLDLSKVKESQDDTDLQGEVACSGNSCEII